MEKNLKLNYKRTLIIGFAFFSILMVWQGYNAYCPLYLKTLLYSILVEKNATEYTEFIVGSIMALDNVLALFMLPIFGKLSDKTKTKYGKRMPYIILGMAATIIAFPFMALCYIWNSLAGLIITMLVVLVIMNIYRSPAVALMPDVTPKPLRSTANGLINLVGYFGPILISVVNMVPLFKFSQGDTDFLKVFTPVIVVVVSLIIAIVVLVLKVNEPKILEEVKDDLALGEELSATQEKVVENKPLSKADKKNMWILLVAVCLWFMCFNAFETFNTMYCDEYYTTYTETQVTEFDEELTYCVKVDDQDKYYIVGEFNTLNVYYVEESGQYSVVKDLKDFKDAKENNPCTKLVAALGEIRNKVPALSYGDYRELQLMNRQYAFSRSYNGTCVVVTVNNDDIDFTMTLPVDCEEEYIGALSGQKVQPTNHHITVNVKANSGDIWVPAKAYGAAVPVETTIDTSKVTSTKKEQKKPTKKEAKSVP